MSDRTPVNVIADAAREHLSDPMYADDLHCLAKDALQALAAAGFRVVPIPDDDTRAEVAELVEKLRGPVGISFASKATHLTVADACRAANALAAAYLDIQPKEKNGI